MESVIFIIALITCIYLIFSLIEMIFGLYKIKNLSYQIPIPSNQLPTLSIIMSALNEEKDIETALLTLVNLNYPHFEIIAINDRSTDKTPEILDRFQAKYPHLKVFHIKELPKGWFGKNHALHFGAEQASGEWLLFTDADVMMHPDTLTKTVSYVLENKLDHLTIYENHRRHYFFPKILYLALYVVYCMHHKPWRIRYSWSKRSLGHGAFNLVSKNAYLKSGGHAAIAMECLDDWQLGYLIKNHGFRQDTADGRDFVEREWYATVYDMINGMKKNSFAFYNYHIIPACRDALFSLMLYIGPFAGALFFEGPIRSLSLVNIGLMLLVSIIVARKFRLEKRYALFYPVGIIMLIYTVFNSIYSVCKDKGVIWRGTYYPLQTIKKKRQSG